MKKLLLGLAGAAIGVFVTMLIASTTIYQSWEHIPTHKGDGLQLNTGWALLVAALFSGLMGRCIWFTNKVGALYAWTLLGTLGYFTYHALATADDPDSRPVIIVIGLAIWFVSALGRHMTWNASTKRFIE